MLTPYQFASNRPIDGIDLDGLEYVRATGDRAEGGMEARDQSAPYIVIDKSKYTKPEIKLIGSDEIGCWAYEGNAPNEYIHSRKLQIFVRKSEALQNGGLVTSGYYYFYDPPLQELENVSTIESSILSAFGSKTNTGRGKITKVPAEILPKPKVQISGGVERAHKFKNNWSRTSLQVTIEKFAPNAPGLVTKSGKIIYSNLETGNQVVYDIDGDYFRIENINLTGNRKYLNLDGVVPNNVTIDGKTRGATKSEYEQATHFKNTDGER